jgi:hypothetical protein
LFDFTETAIVSDGEERIQEGVCSVARIESATFCQKVDDLRVSLAHREMQRRGVVILAREQPRVAFGQLRHAVELTREARAEHVPHLDSRGDSSIVKLHRVRLFHFR